jgi:ribosomal protein S14
MRWLRPEWWQYLLAPPARDTRRWVAFRCRMDGHPRGVVWFNAVGTEPDMRCKVCGDDLG